MMRFCPVKHGVRSTDVLYQKERCGWSCSAPLLSAALEAKPPALRSTDGAHGTCAGSNAYSCTSSAHGQCSLPSAGSTTCELGRSWARSARAAVYEAARKHVDFNKSRGRVHWDADL